jgi:hypothetical protein
MNFSTADILPFFVSMATAAKFVQPIPIFLAYLVPLAVDVVPIKFHQFLFGVFKMVAVAAVAMETAKMLKN